MCPCIDTSQLLRIHDWLGKENVSPQTHPGEPRAADTAALGMSWESTAGVPSISRRNRAWASSQPASRQLKNSLGGLAGAQERLKRCRANPAWFITRRNKFSALVRCHSWYPQPCNAYSSFRKQTSRDGLKSSVSISILLITFQFSDNTVKFLDSWSFSFKKGRGLY